ncbi:sodium:proton antiporter [Ornithinimicrobium murale]|uniref:sodium:proton antiporter n=1 Tax=Ornithinimicrobium murale TaxID=1050153 RepID=UPI000E0D604C|nr:NADH-quinone oxidoreductase subunit K [Ornithinimicrobium murale]
MSAAVLVAVLVAGGVYLLLQRGLVRAALGFVLLGHAANVIVLAAGGQQDREPAYVGNTLPETGLADPLVQAFALTAIVITFALTVYLFAMAGHGGDDDGESSDAEPSDEHEHHGTVVDGPPSGGHATSAEPIGTSSTGDVPTGRTTGREHA